MVDWLFCRLNEWSANKTQICNKRLKNEIIAHNTRNNTRQAKKKIPKLMDGWIVDLDDDYVGTLVACKVSWPRRKKRKYGLMFIIVTWQ